MARMARVVVPNTPHHIIQRGHNRQTVFASDEDYQYYLETLWEWKGKLKCRLYSYCLMTNHVHLIIEPGEDVTSLGKLMKRLAGRQTRYVNTLEKRTGSLWEGRFKSHPIETERYLMTCCRYIELNPVRAKIVTGADDYLWSSYRSKIGLNNFRKVDEDLCYRALGENETARQTAYQEMVELGISSDEIKAIREASQHGHPLGGQRFKDEIENKLDIRLTLQKRGRPRKSGSREMLL